jgi:hypothetical protein
VIEPVDDEERRLLLAELVAERFGPRPWRPGMEETPRVLAARRRVLVGIERESG